MTPEKCEPGIPGNVEHYHADVLWHVYMSVALANIPTMCLQISKYRCYNSTNLNLTLLMNCINRSHIPQARLTSITYM